MNFADVAKHVEDLYEQAKYIDDKRGPHFKPLFDQQLFSCRAKLLLPCVKETQHFIRELLAEKKTQLLTPERTTYLCERIMAQLQALQREIHTQGVRFNEPKPKNQFYKDIYQLRQNYAQHQEWERRLKKMLEDKEREFANPNSNFGYHGTSKAQIEKEVLRLEERHLNCVNAMKKLERQIVYQEQREAR